MPTGSYYAKKNDLKMAGSWRREDVKRVIVSDRATVPGPGNGRCWLAVDMTGQVAGLPGPDVDGRLLIRREPRFVFSRKNIHKTALH